MDITVAGDTITFAEANSTATRRTVILNTANLGYYELENIRDLEDEFILVYPDVEFMHHAGEIAVADVASGVIIRAPVTQAHRDALAGVVIPDMPIAWPVDMMPEK